MHYQFPACQAPATSALPPRRCRSEAWCSNEAGGGSLCGGFPPSRRSYNIERSSADAVRPPRAIADPLHSLLTILSRGSEQHWVWQRSTSLDSCREPHRCGLRMLESVREQRLAGVDSISATRVREGRFRLCQGSSACEPNVWTGIQACKPPATRGEKAAIRKHSTANSYRFSSTSPHEYIQPRLRIGCEVEPKTFSLSISR